MIRRTKVVALIFFLCALGMAQCSRRAMNLVTDAAAPGDEGQDSHRRISAVWHSEARRRNRIHHRN